MKILQIINSLGTGGAEKLLLDTIPIYRKLGIEMDILILWNNNHQFTQKLIDLNCCKVYVLKQSTNVKDVYNPLNILKIRKVLKNYDVAHIHLFPAQYFVPIANIGLNKKLIFTEHNTSNKRIKNKFFKPLEQWCYARYKKLICITSEIKEIYDNYLQLGFKSIVINNGVDLLKIKEAKPLDKIISNASFSKDTIIIQISAFREQKDQDTVVKCLQYLPENFKVIFVGDGFRKNEVVALSKKLGVNDRILFLGQRMDVPQLLKSSDYVVLSTKYEGLSLASVEGLASGKPFLATNVPGLKEIVEGAGVLFELGNSKQLATKILELENNPELRSKVISNSIQRAEKYDIKLMIQKHITLYKQVYEN